MTAGRRHEVAVGRRDEAQVVEGHGRAEGVSLFPVSGERLAQVRRRPLKVPAGEGDNPQMEARHGYPGAVAQRGESGEGLPVVLRGAVVLPALERQQAKEEVRVRCSPGVAPGAPQRQALLDQRDALFGVAAEVGEHPRRGQRGGTHRPRHLLAVLQAAPQPVAAFGAVVSPGPQPRHRHSQPQQPLRVPFRLQPDQRRPQLSCSTANWSSPATPRKKMRGRVGRLGEGQAPGRRAPGGSAMSSSARR